MATEAASGINGIYKHAGFGERPTVTSLRDVSAAEFIKAYAAHLKKSNRMVLPEWVDYVKTAAGRELPPLDPDWYYVRAASVARKIYLNHGLGVGALAHWYGKAAAKGNKPQHHVKASRKVIRHILNQVRAEVAVFPKAHADFCAEVALVHALSRSVHCLILYPTCFALSLQLEETGIVEKLDNGGRAVSREGQKDLDTIARSATLTQ